MKILVSACLLGRNCKYSGGNNRNGAVISFCRGKDVVAVCPEVEAGLPVPRPPVEIRDGKVVRADGSDWDSVYRAGVAAVLRRCHASRETLSCAILKAGSPTCGVHEVYDGTFSHRKVPGQGVLAEALASLGVPVFDEHDVENGKIK